ncbi:MAG: C1 family peptidase [Nostoc sp.]|uniref:C1 family peptidase n=1 Tax=Nostoc sp. TaxID=1180 RepID=UPI002FFD551A
MENSSNQQQKKDWNKKRLGWIPDYPDLRDYSLGDEEVIKNNLRFKIEGRTRDFEKVVEDFINLLSDSIPINSLNQEKIKELKNQIFGNVVFAKVKVHKLLRESLELEIIKRTNHQYPCNPITYERILSSQIVDLKKYLGILSMKGYLSSSEKGSVNFNQPVEIVDWMRNAEYDSTTKSLVKDFQCRSKIMDDGIVGLETYTTLNECFSDPTKLCLLKESGRNPNKKGLSKIKYFAVTSLISRAEFEIILDILKCQVIKQICKEFTEYIKNNSYKNPQIQVTELKKKIFEYDFLETIIDANNSSLFENREIFKKLEVKDIDINNFKEEIKAFIINNGDDTSNIVEVLQNLSGTELIFSVLMQIVSPLLSQWSNSSNIVELLQNSSVTEPIFSVVIRILSPLSQWSNLTWEEMIKKGFDKFEKIANRQIITNNSNPEPGYYKEELVKSAIFQVISLMKLEITSIDKEDESDLFVYFLLKKYLNQFEKYTLDAENEIKFSKDKELKTNILDKQEMFEIELTFNYGNNPSTTENNEQKQSEDLFKTLDLYIPLIISNSYLNKFKINNEKNKPPKKLYFLLPAVVDLSYWCSPVRDQGSLNSCTAFAAIALLEYFENRNFGNSVDASPLFLYKTARQKMNVEGDVGTSIRETIKVLALFGVPPEQSWPYEEDKVDEEPPPYCYAYAQNYKTLKYFLLDYAGITTESLLFQVKAVLAAGFPCIFGLTIYTSAYEETNYKKGHIPYPDPNKDKVVGGHTAVVVGYDDYKFIRCADRKHYSRGAFLIRNSWGTEWGVNGYGWLPYDYVLAGLTAAWWSLLKAEWFDESNFGSARTGGDGSDTGTQGGGGTIPPGHP